MVVRPLNSARDLAKFGNKAPACEDQLAGGSVVAGLADDRLESRWSYVEIGCKRKVANEVGAEALCNLLLFTTTEVTATHTL